MNKRKIASIEINNNKIFINPVLNFLDGIVANHVDHDFGRYNRLRFITGGLLKRRVEKAYPGTRGTITVDIYLSDKYIEISIRDKGVPAWEDLSYDKEKLDINSNQQMRNLLLDYMVDDFGMEKMGKDGQRVFVRMNILNKLKFRKPEPYKEEEVFDTNITIKPVTTEEEAVEAIRCIYSEYGYSYAYERLYYIDSFLQAIRNKELMSFLAVNEHGQTAGHFALAFSGTFQNMPEISTVVTRKEFRGLGLFAKFMDYSMKLGRELGIRAFMGQPVAFHPFSQKAFLKAEFSATAVLLEYIDSTIESEYNKNNERLDLFASVKILDPMAKSILYPPEEIRDFTESIFQKIGCGYEIKGESKLAENTDMSVENSSALKATKILLTCAGADFQDILKDTVNHSIRSHNEMIELLIVMNDPSCAEAYKIAKQNGFAFSGLIPGAQNADYMVMQMLVGKDCSYDHLVTVGEFEELTNDIKIMNGKE